MTKTTAMLAIVHFKVVFLVRWPLSGSETDFVLIQTCLLFICKCTKNLSIKTRSTFASIPLKSQVAQHMTVKRAIQVITTSDIITNGKGWRLTFKLLFDTFKHFGFKPYGITSC